MEGGREGGREEGENGREKGREGERGRKGEREGEEGREVERGREEEECIINTCEILETFNPFQNSFQSQVHGYGNRDRAGSPARPVSPQQKAGKSKKFW